jgi:hypothetical protein
VHKVSIRYVLGRLVVAALQAGGRVAAVSLPSTCSFDNVTGLGIPDGPTFLARHESH